MPETTTTTERFPAGTKETRLEEEQRMRIRADAVVSTYQGSEAEGWVLTATWEKAGAT